MSVTRDPPPGQAGRPTSRRARRLVRLGAPILPTPVRAGSEVAFARVRGGRLSREGVRDGDHVLLVPGHGARGRRRSNPVASLLGAQEALLGTQEALLGTQGALLGTQGEGALASVVDRTGRGSLWRVRRDRDALALYDGGDVPVARTGPWPDVAGVVVGVLRKFPA